jgi:ribosomal protein S27AE
MRTRERDYDIDNPEDEELYALMLNEIYGIIDVCGMKFDADHALKELDPIAYRCGAIDFFDSLEKRWECGVCNEVYLNKDDADACCKI